MSMNMHNGLIQQLFLLDEPLSPYITKMPRYEHFSSIYFYFNTARDKQKIMWAILIEHLGRSKVNAYYFELNLQLAVVYHPTIILCFNFNIIVS